MTTDAPKPARAPRKPKVPPKAAETPQTDTAPPAPPRTRTPRKPTAKAQAHEEPPPPANVPVPNSRPVVVDPDALPGESKAGEEPFKLTVNIPRSLYERASGLIWNADFTGEPPEVTSMTSLVRVALVDAVARYEKKYNAGMAFPPPARLRRGRAPKQR